MRMLKNLDKGRVISRYAKGVKVFLTTKTALKSCLLVNFSDNIYIGITASTHKNISPNL